MCRTNTVSCLCLVYPATVTALEQKSLWRHSRQPKGQKVHRTRELGVGGTVVALQVRGVAEAFQQRIFFHSRSSPDDSAESSWDMEIGCEASPSTAQLG